MTDTTNHAKPRAQIAADLRVAFDNAFAVYEDAQERGVSAEMRDDPTTIAVIEAARASYITAHDAYSAFLHGGYPDRKTP